MRILLAVVLILITSSAHGQAFPAVPTPVTKETVDRYTRWLELTDAQREAIETLHEAYVAEWSDASRELIDEAKRAVVKAVRVREAREPGIMLEVAVAHAFAHTDGLRTSMSAHDDRFFEEISAVLEGEQAVRMMRVRNARQRETLAASLDEMPAATVDPIELVEVDLEPSDAEYAKLETVIAICEAEYVERLRACSDARRSGARLMAQRVDILRQLESDSVGPDDRSDLLFRADQAIMKNGRMCIGPSDNLARYVREFLGSMKTVLEPSRARELESLFRAAAYPDIWPAEGTASVRFAAASMLEGLTIEQRQDVALAMANWSDLNERLTVEAIAAADRRGWALVEHRPGHPETARNEAMTIDRLLDERSRLDAKQTDVLASILDEDQMRRITVK